MNTLEKLATLLMVMFLVMLLVFAVLMLPQAHALMMGTKNVSPTVPQGVDNSEYANNNRNGQACNGSAVLECEMLSDLDKIVYYLVNIWQTDQSIDNHLNNIEKELKK